MTKYIYRIGCIKHAADCQLKLYPANNNDKNSQILGIDTSKGHSIKYLYGDCDCNGPKTYIEVDEYFIEQSAYLTALFKYNVKERTNALGVSIKAIITTFDWQILSAINELCDYITIKMVDLTQLNFQSFDEPIHISFRLINEIIQQNIQSRDHPLYNEYKSIFTNPQFHLVKSIIQLVVKHNKTKEFTKILAKDYTDTTVEYVQQTFIQNLQKLLIQIQNEKIINKRFIQINYQAIINYLDYFMFTSIDYIRELDLYLLDLIIITDPKQTLQTLYRLQKFLNPTSCDMLKLNRLIS